MSLLGYLASAREWKSHKCNRHELSKPGLWIYSIFPLEASPSLGESKTRASPVSLVHLFISFNWGKTCPHIWGGSGGFSSDSATRDAKKYIHWRGKCKHTEQAFLFLMEKFQGILSSPPLSWEEKPQRGRYWRAGTCLTAARWHTVWATYSPHLPRLRNIHGCSFWVTQTAKTKGCPAPSKNVNW